MSWLTKLLDKADDPLEELAHGIDRRIDGMKHDLELAIYRKLLREGVLMGLTRLTVIDGKNKAKYEEAMLLVGDEK